MRDCLGTLAARNLDHPLRDQWAGNTGPQKILILVKRRGLKHWENEITRKFVLQIIDVAFGGPGFQRLFF